MGSGFMDRWKAGLGRRRLGKNLYSYTHQIPPPSRTCERNNPGSYRGDYILRAGEKEPFFFPLRGGSDDVCPDGDGGFVIGGGDVVDLFLFWFL